MAGIAYLNIPDHQVSVDLTGILKNEHEYDFHLDLLKGIIAAVYPQRTLSIHRRPPTGHPFYDTALGVRAADRADIDMKLLHRLFRGNLDRVRQAYRDNQLRLDDGRPTVQYIRAEGLDRKPSRGNPNQPTRVAWIDLRNGGSLIHRAPSEDPNRPAQRERTSTASIPY